MVTLTDLERPTSIFYLLPSFESYLEQCDCVFLVTPLPASTSLNAALEVTYADASS